MSRTAESDDPIGQSEQREGAAGAKVPDSAGAPDRTSRFVSNVMWGLLGVGVNLFIGLFLTPLIVRGLGIEQYGVWVLLFSTADYLRIFDFGFRSAVVNACARLRTRGDWDGINQKLTTAFAYYFAVGAGCWLLAVLFRDPVVGAFNIALPLRPTAGVLVAIVAGTISLRLMLAPVTAALEAFQRFDLINRAYIGALVLRAVGCVTVLLLGYGLIELAWVVLLVQVVETCWNIASLHRIAPALRPSIERVRKDSFTDMFRYGRYSALMAAADLMSIHGAITLLGALRGPAEVAAFALPYRLLFYIAEVMSKVSGVTASATAALDEAGDRARVWRIAVQTNRQCFAFFMPVGIFMLLYGTPLLRVLVSDEVANESGGLIPIFLLMFVFAVAGQYNSGGVLIGQGKHSSYAYLILTEVALMTTGLLIFAPAHGAIGAAWVASIAFLVTRGFALAFVLCYRNGFPFRDYVAAIYGRGLAVASIVLPLGFLLRNSVWAGNSWSELLLACATIGGVYYGLAYLVVLGPEERAAALHHLLTPLQRFRSASPRAAAPLAAAPSSSPLMSASPETSTAAARAHLEGS